MQGVMRWAALLALVGAVPVRASTYTVNATADGPSAHSQAIRAGRKTIKIRITNTATVTAECDVMGDGDFVTVPLPDGTLSSAATTSAIIMTDVWCEGGFRVTVASCSSCAVSAGVYSPDP